MADLEINQLPQITELSLGDVAHVNEAGNSNASRKASEQQRIDLLNASQALETGALKDGAVTTPKIDDSAVTTEKLEDGSVSSQKLEDGSVTTPKINNEAVTTEKIKDGDVTNIKIANQAVAFEKIQNIPERSFLGRNSSGLGSTEDLTVDEARSLLGVMGSGFISGLICSNNLAAANRDINVSPGSARDFTDMVTMVLTGPLIKRTDLNWAAGGGQGGLDTGSTTLNTGYGVYLIRRSDTGVVDIIFSVDKTAAGNSVVMPANYDQKRFIGFYETNLINTNVLPFRQYGDVVLRRPAEPDIKDVSPVSGQIETATLIRIPPFSEINFNIEAVMSSPARSVVISIGDADGPTLTDVMHLVLVNLDISRASSLGVLTLSNGSQMKYEVTIVDGTLQEVELEILLVRLLARTEPYN